MTQYYEPKARQLEAEANRSPNGSGVQAWLWAEAARVGTRVEYCIDGFELWPKGAKRCEDCDNDC